MGRKKPGKVSVGRTEYLQVMAYAVAAIGRVDGSGETWVAGIPEGLWSIYELRPAVIRRIAFLIGCSPKELRP